MIKWILQTLAVLALVGSIFGAGVYVGELRVKSDAKDTALATQGEVIVTLRDEIKSSYARGAEDAAREAALKADRAAMQEWLKANAARRVDIGAELRRAIDAMDLSLCTLSDDVQRVRQRAVQEVIDASRPPAGQGGP
ncbi:MAG: hypothetical protein IPK64_19940 [bacterium]|nr:hypothetical protein [bacterium]